jgi:predicted dehydrogenase
MVYAVSARDQARAQEYAQKWGIEKVYGGATGYQGELRVLTIIHTQIYFLTDMLDDPEVEVVYNPVRFPMHMDRIMLTPCLVAAGRVAL